MHGSLGVLLLHATNASCIATSFTPSWIVTAYAIGNISVPANCFLHYGLGVKSHPTYWEVVLSVLQT
jgi:hypothetical protein